MALSGANCGNRWGKALVHFPFEWRLFNPNAAAGAQWEVIPGYPHSSTASYSGGTFANPEAVALGDTNCGVSCGKVFIKVLGYKALDDPSPRRWELYNPVTNTFEQYPYLNALEELDVAKYAKRSLRLVDGRVLMVGTRAVGWPVPTAGETPVAKLFDPAAFNPALASLVPSFADDAPPVNNWSNNQFTGDPTGRLASGRILFTGGPPGTHVSEIYTPDPNRGLGRWSPAGSDCTPLDSAVDELGSCLVLASLPNGKVLATTSKGSQGENRDPTSSTGKTFIFDPATSGWSASASAVAASRAVTHGVLLGAASSGLAGKVLTAGHSTTSSGASLAAQLYTPAGPESPVIPKYVAFGDSLTTSFSVPQCRENRIASPWACDSASPPAVPYPDRVAMARGYTYSDDPAYYKNPAFFPNPGYPGTTLDRVGIWGDSVKDALRGYNNGRNIGPQNEDRGDWKPQFKAIELATELVTGSLGVNDLRWSDLKEWYLLYSEGRYLGGERVKAEAQRRLGAQRPAFEQMFRSMSVAKNAGASVVVVLYYNPYYNGLGCSASHDISQTLVDVLNDEFLRYYAARNGLMVADLRPVFAGHGAGVGDDKEYTFGKDCSTARAISEQESVPWPLFGSLFAPLTPPFVIGDPLSNEDDILRLYDPHPNNRGTTAIANTIVGCLNQPSSCVAQLP